MGTLMGWGRGSLPARFLIRSLVFMSWVCLAIGIADLVFSVHVLIGGSSIGGLVPAIFHHAYALPVMFSITRDNFLR